MGTGSGRREQGQGDKKTNLPRCFQHKQTYWGVNQARGPQNFSGTHTYWNRCFGQMVWTRDSRTIQPSQQMQKSTHFVTWGRNQPIQNVSEKLKAFFQNTKKIHEISFFRTDKIFVFRKNYCWSSWKRIRKDHKIKGRRNYLYLWVRFFLLTMVHNDQGLTQLRRFCETVGAASQISYMLVEDFHFYLQTDTWI